MLNLGQFFSYILFASMVFESNVFGARCELSDFAKFEKLNIVKHLLKLSK